MENRWEEIRRELALADRNESQVHPHVIEERSQYFHSADYGSTEYEFLNLLHAMVLATKPNLVLETGTYLGYGTIALATALEANTVGELISLDLEGCDSARALCARYGLNRVQFIQAEAVQWCRSYSGAPFDFVFHDSGGHRTEEHEALKGGGKLAPGAIVVFHDTSRWRCGPNPNTAMVSYLEQSFPKGIAIHLSRGLTFAQL